MSGIAAVDIRRAVIVVAYDTSLGLGDKTFRPDFGVGRITRHDIAAGIVAGYASEAGVRSGQRMSERDPVDDTLGYYAEAVLSGDSSGPDSGNKGSLHRALQHASARLHPSLLGSAAHDPAGTGAATGSDYPAFTGKRAVFYLTIAQARDSACRKRTGHTYPHSVAAVHLHAVVSRDRTRVLSGDFGRYHIAVFYDSETGAGDHSGG